VGFTVVAIDGAIESVCMGYGMKALGLSVMVSLPQNVLK